MNKEIITRLAGRSGLYLKKYSPEIMTGIAMVGTVATAYLAVKASRKTDPIVEVLKGDIDEIREVTVHDTRSKEQIDRQVAKRYVSAGLELTKVWTPAVAMGATTIGCILGAHGVLHKRNVALAAFAKASETAFSEYRERVAEQIGADKENDLYEGRKTITEIDPETGKKKKTVVNVGSSSHTSRVFDDSISSWSPIHDHNLIFLNSQQSYLNDLLKIRGHVLLNDVYDRLGFERTPYGGEYGWVWHGPEGRESSNYIDFGIGAGETIIKQLTDGSTYDTGYIQLDFKGASYVLDLIGKKWG